MVAMCEHSEETKMVHYECNVCTMTATCVMTPSAVLAWHEHMEKHVDPRAFGQWTWDVVPLQF